jgi:hypothetical protein
MPPRPVVSTVIRFEPPVDRPVSELIRAEAGLAVELEGEVRARLDPADERSTGFAQILVELSKLRLPVYLELDPETSAIVRLLIPHVTRVLGITPIDTGVFNVYIERSQARHVLRRDAPNFEELDRNLREALERRIPVILSEDDAHEIIDVRDYRGPNPPPFVEPEIPVRPVSLQGVARDVLRLLRCDWLWSLIRWRCCCVSPAKAQQVFDDMSATSCEPLTVPVPCIPFLYPDDGCWARASEMCRLMIAQGLKPGKVWIQGVLHVDTRNNPQCFVDWRWHVAPTLCVRGRRRLETHTMVIDPSLFTAPVTKAGWKAVQGDPFATLTDTDASVYTFVGGITTDPTYTQTDADLAYYRLQLRARAVQQGPPPYASCP